MKLQPIERGEDGSLPRMKPGQRKRANALIRKTCCNYENGNCLLLDDGDTCTCPQTVSYPVCCKWFRWAVLPQDKALEAEIFRNASVKRCAECGAAFVPRSNRAKYCEAYGDITRYFAEQGILFYGKELIRPTLAQMFHRKRG